MITCMGLIVGMVQSMDRKDVLRQCVAFLVRYPHLRHRGVEFLIDNELYCTVSDTHVFEDGYLGAMFNMYNGNWDGAQVKIA